MFQLRSDKCSLRGNGFVQTFFGQSRKTSREHSREHPRQRHHCQNESTAPDATRMKPGKGKIRSSFGSKVSRLKRFACARTKTSVRAPLSPCSICVPSVAHLQGSPGKARIPVPYRAAVCLFSLMHQSPLCVRRKSSPSEAASEELDGSPTALVDRSSNFGLARNTCASPD